MGTMMIAIKGFSWLFGTCIILALGMATSAQWAVFLAMGAAVMQIGYTGYKWAKEVYGDIRTGKKKMPFKRKK